MKRTLLLFFTLVAASISYENQVAISMTAYIVEITLDEAWECFNEAKLTDEEWNKFDTLTVDDFQTTDSNNTALKFGCLFVCLGQKKELMTGAHINVTKIKEAWHAKPEGTRPGKLDEFDQIIDSCANQVETKTNECEVGFTFIICSVNELMRRWNMRHPEARSQKPEARNCYGRVRIATDVMKLTTNEAWKCFNESNLTQEDFNKLDTLTVDDFQTTDSNNTALKYGCLYACLGQEKEWMTGAHINATKIKEVVHAKPEGNRPGKLDEFDQIVDSCANQVESKTNECEVGFTFLLCTVDEVKRRYFENK